MNQVLELIHNRKSTRTFANKTISAESKKMIIDATLRSPTAGNMMLYSIIEVADQDIKDKLVKSCDNQPFIAKAPLVLLFLADYQRWYDYFLNSDVDVYCKTHGSEMRLPGEGDLMLAVCDTLIAAQTSVLAAESLGIGSCYIGDIMENFEFHRELFNLPPYTFPVSMLCFGYPSDGAIKRKKTTRINSKHILHQNCYQSSSDEELKEMFTTKEPANFIDKTTNAGQHFYQKKFGSDFSIEMTRSVKEAVKRWCGK